MGAIMAAAVSAMEWQGVTLSDVVYTSVNSKVTHEDPVNGLSLTANWSSAELIHDAHRAHVLAMGLQVAGVDLSGDITAYVKIEDPDVVGSFEIAECKVPYVKPEQKTDDNGGYVYGVTKSTTTGANHTVTNMYGAATPAATEGPWFGDSTKPGVSYSSWFEYKEPETQTYCLGDTCVEAVDIKIVAEDGEVVEESSEVAEENSEARRL